MIRFARSGGPAAPDGGPGRLHRPQRWSQVAARHTVHREAAYAGLPVKVRARLHARVGDVLAPVAAQPDRSPRGPGAPLLQRGTVATTTRGGVPAGRGARPSTGPRRKPRPRRSPGPRSRRPGRLRWAWRNRRWTWSLGYALFLCGRSVEADRATPMPAASSPQHPCGSPTWRSSWRRWRSAGRYAVALREPRPACGTSPRSAATTRWPAGRGCWPDAA